MATTKITSPDLFNLESLNTALKLPSGTTAQRPTSPSTGEWRYNTTTNLVEFWDGGAWRDLQSENIPPIPSENFNTVIWTGNGTSQSITGVGFKPDWVWGKERSNTSSNELLDTTRGATNYISTNLTNAQGTSGQGLQSFDADGFTVGNDGAWNQNGETYVAWCWKANGGTTSSNTDGSITSTVQANTKAAFSIMQYTGTGANATVGHGLSSAPELVIVKKTSGVQNWMVGATVVGWTKYLELNTTNAAATASTTWNDTAPTTTTVSLGSSNNGNTSGQTYIMYAFSSVAGYSKFGSYTGNGSANGPIVETGFEVGYVMLKDTSSAGEWWIVDSTRGSTQLLQAQSSSAELTTDALVTFLSNGFQITRGDGNMNGSGNTFIYMAFASDASAAPALPDSFANKLYTGNGTTQSITGLGFSPSWVWTKSRTNTNSHALYDSVRGINKELNSNSTDAEGSLTDGLSSFDTDGFTVGARANSNQNSQNFVAWNWKANPVPTINTDGTIQSIVSANQAAGFSIVKWTTNGSASQFVGHGLSVAPSIIIYKRLDGAQDWFFETDIIGGSYNYLNLNTTGAAQAGGAAWSTRSTSTTISAFTSSNNLDYIAYCFASISGFSKFGTYTGDGTTTKTITTGFQPNFVLIKVTDATDNWVILDSARGGSKNLKPNSSAAEATESGTNVEFLSTGFKLIGSGAGLGQVNGNGNDYIYMAFKENPGTPAAIPAGEVAYLVIAAGGGAGGVGGGGGAGGLRTSYGNYTGGGQSAESNITLSAQTYTITIGAGGTASATGGAFNNDGNTGSNGTSSVFGTITSLGGGGGTGGGNTALSGGSGGGCRSGSPGSGTYGQGFDGATGDIGGGGGGAGGAGLSSTAGSCGANGGPGLNVPITGATTFYAGGGAGGVSFASGCSASSGGIGGGGDAGANAGTANTGGGGGGGSWTNNANYTTQGGGNGGSGAVILRMNTSDYSGTTTGSPTVTTDGSETILTYTGSGTYVHS